MRLWEVSQKKADSLGNDAGRTGGNDWRGPSLYLPHSNR